MQAQDKIFQLKITLEDSKPSIWRRVVVPSDMTFHELHMTIQIVFGWEDAHIYEFQHDGDIYALDPQDTPFRLSDNLPNERDAATHTIDNAFPQSSEIRYIYDFGDSWVHKIKLEKVLEGEAYAFLPLCLGGARPCPPEDCGGMGGYAELLQHPDFDPGVFDVNLVNDMLLDAAEGHGEDFDDDDFAGFAHHETPRNPPSRAQWQKLFAAAKEAGKCKPWERITEKDLIQLDIPSQKEPVFVCVMGGAGECVAVAAFYGYQALAHLLQLSNADEDTPWYVLAHLQNCVTCYFGNREDVEPADREVYDLLGLKFRGKGKWIFFRRMEPGFFPWHITDEEAVLMTAALEQSMDLFRMESPPAAGTKKVLLKQDGLWQTQSMPRIPLTLEGYIFDDEAVLAQLRRCKRTTAAVEMEKYWFPVPVQSESDARPFFPTLFMLAKKGAEPYQHIWKKYEDAAEVVFAMLTDYIYDHGIPKSISVRGDGMLPYLMDICKKLGIKLKTVRRLHTVEMVLEEMVDKMERMDV